ncbi:MAG: hypothetical protein U9O20_02125 [Patescibacteria group bacterium]|nr:hypothetical protein [Patescibacteria group bacterium]
MKLITISGLDGSGKTSQINFLKDHLEDQGKKIYYFHAIEFSFANKLVSLFNKKKSKYDSQAEAKTSAGKISVFLRKLFLIIDVLRFGRFYKKLEKEGCEYVLTDRFFFDQMINIVFLANRSEFDDNRWWQKLAEKNLRRPDFALFLEVTPHTILSRQREIEQGNEYLEKKYKLYDYFAKTRNLQRIDGEQSRNEVLEDIKKAVNVI